jgi:hypothetical protein
MLHVLHWSSLDKKLLPPIEEVQVEYLIAQAEFVEYPARKNGKPPPRPHKKIAKGTHPAGQSYCNRMLSDGEIRA